MDRMKEYLKDLRDALCYVFSWLVICVIAVSALGGNEEISVSFLMKLLLFSIWSSAAFIASFRSSYMKKKGFIIQLTAFYILFIPAEIVFFYSMGMFEGSGKLISWIAFFTIIAVLYILALLIDVLIMKKRSVAYTEKLEEYKKNL